MFRYVKKCLGFVILGLLYIPNAYTIHLPEGWAIKYTIDNNHVTAYPKTPGKTGQNYEIPRDTYNAPQKLDQ